MVLDRDVVIVDFRVDVLSVEVEPKPIRRFPLHVEADVLRHVPVLVQPAANADSGAAWYQTRRLVQEDAPWSCTPIIAGVEHRVALVIHAEALIRSR